MARRRYFRAELEWVFGVCSECHRSHDESGKPLLVARVPRSREGRKCEPCLRRHRRIAAERKTA